MAYTDQMVNDFLELAQEVGITRAMRELQYPGSWATANKWAKQRNINIDVDEIKAKASETREWYKEEEIKITAQEGLNRIYFEWVNNASLTADEIKKLSAAFKDVYAVWANVQGKANNINENRNTDSFDANIEALLNEERARNIAKKELTE